MHDIHTNSAPSKIVLRHHLFMNITQDHSLKIIIMYTKKFNLEKLRQAVPIFGAKVWNEIPGRMRDRSKKVFKQKLISVLF